jgi:hypothetical protein
MGKNPRKSAKIAGRPPAVLAAVFMLTATFAGCGAVGSTLMNMLPDSEEYKRIVIYDTDPLYKVQIKDLNGQRVILALWDAKTEPAFDKITGEELMEKPFSIGEIKNSSIDLKLSYMLDRWTDSGDYWVLFALPDKRGDKVSNGYISKEPHRIFKQTTWLFNGDFMLPVILNIDLTGVLPF